MVGELSPIHWAIVAIVLVALFGSKKLPDAARSLGKSMRILKTEMKALHDDEPVPGVAETVAPVAAVAVAAEPPAPTD